MKTETELKTDYEHFIQTDSGKEWQEHWKKISPDNRSGDFGDYLYDFYPYMLQ